MTYEISMYLAEKFRFAKFCSKDNEGSCKNLILFRREKPEKLLVVVSILRNEPVSIWTAGPSLNGGSYEFPSTVSLISKSMK